MKKCRDFTVLGEKVSGVRSEKCRKGHNKYGLGGVGNGELEQQDSIILLYDVL